MRQMVRCPVSCFGLLLYLLDRHFSPLSSFWQAFQPSQVLSCWQVFQSCHIVLTDGPTFSSVFLTCSSHPSYLSDRSASLLFSFWEVFKSPVIHFLQMLQSPIVCCWEVLQSPVILFWQVLEHPMVTPHVWNGLWAKIWQMLLLAPAELIIVDVVAVLLILSKE